MKAKEYYNSTRMVETKNWTLDMAMNFAEEYYEARTKALTIPVVSKSFYCYNKEKGFTHSLCEVSQCKRCKKVDEQLQ